MSLANTLANPPETLRTLRARPVVFVVDDDPAVRESLESLISAAGWRVQVFGSAEAFMARPPIRAASCLVLDVSLPDLNGLELQERMVGGNPDEMPIIFITGHGSVPMTVRAMKAGAVEFLTKPFRGGVLLRAIAHALERSSVTLQREAERSALRERYALLTPRETQVMERVVRGRLNKQIGCELGISEITVKAHRGRVMEKMAAQSLPDLVNMAASLGLAPMDLPAGE
jgi:FixJ family two-component response regulator